MYFKNRKRAGMPPLSTAIFPVPFSKFVKCKANPIRFQVYPGH
jgi:hypothetical protein